MGMHCGKQTRSKQSEKKRMRDWDRIRKELPERKEKRKREREREELQSYLIAMLLPSMTMGLRPAIGASGLEPTDDDGAPPVVIGGRGT